tara:strand:- start:1787 stop:1906 length:120 start_codon:yes stop_codon:yes gene_type:complete
MKWLRLLVILMAATANPQYLFIQTELNRQWWQRFTQQLA